MTGGLIQLVAYGIEDLFLTGDPQITFFKIVYRRHTNFSTEPIPQFFSHDPDFGKRVSCIISRNGDLIRKMHLVITLPSIPKFKDNNNNIDKITKFAWVKRIGYALIRNIEIEIGNELIDKQYGDWLNIWHELIYPNNKDISKMLGDIKELTDLTNGKKTYRLFVPLQFWFCRFAGLSLPIISLQYSYVKINLELRKFDEVSIIAPTHYINIENDIVNFEPFEYLEQNVNGSISLARFIHFDIINKRLYFLRLTDNGFLSPSEIGEIRSDKFIIRGLSSQFETIPTIGAVEKKHRNDSINFKNISLKDVFLIVEYIFLDEDERIKFYQTRHEYLIEQLQYNGEKTITGTNQSFKLCFTNPCKEIFWVTQLTFALNNRINQLFNYTDSLIQNKNGQYIGRNIILRETILFNGLERISFRDSNYFTKIQPYQHHKHNPAEGINIYSFSLYPENYQPSGSANISRIDNIVLKLSVIPKINFKNTAKFRAYALVYNIFRVANGISGLVFSINRPIEGI